MLFHFSVFHLFSVRGAGISLNNERDNSAANIKRNNGLGPTVLQHNLPLFFLQSTLFFNVFLLYRIFPFVNARDETIPRPIAFVRMGYEFISLLSSFH